MATIAKGSSITMASAVSAARTMYEDAPRRLRAAPRCPAPPGTPPLRPVTRAAPRAACEITDMSGPPLVPGLHAEEDHRQRDDDNREHRGDGRAVADLLVLEEILVGEIGRDLRG